MSKTNASDISRSEDGRKGTDCRSRTVHVVTVKSATIGDEGGRDGVIEAIDRRIFLIPVEASRTTRIPPRHSAGRDQDEIRAVHTPTLLDCSRELNWIQISPMTKQINHFIMHNFYL